MLRMSSLRLIFFFNDTATTEIYTLSLHDALPISLRRDRSGVRAAPAAHHRARCHPRSEEHTSELQSLAYLVCRLLLEKNKLQARGHHLFSLLHGLQNFSRLRDRPGASFFNDTATTEIYPLSLHDALPI